MTANEFQNQIKIALKFLVIFSLISGLIYPIFLNGFAALFFPWQANGSLIQENNQIKGSLLIGQHFESPFYFWGRPSETKPFPYNACASSGSNFGPSNPEFLTIVKKRIEKLQKSNPTPFLEKSLPVDLVTASASGLDPELSPRAVFYQIPRVAKARKINEETLKTLVTSLIKPRLFKILGEPSINILELNLALDHLAPQKRSIKNHV